MADILGNKLVTLLEGDSSAYNFLQYVDFFLDILASLDLMLSVGE